MSKTEDQLLQERTDYMLNSALSQVDDWKRRAEIAERDTERLDWWGSQHDFWTVRTSRGCDLWGPGPKSTAKTYGSFETLRHAIDAAMRAGKERPFKRERI